MLWKCCTQYASKFGKLSSGHRTGKGQLLFQSQRKAMPRMFKLPYNCAHFTCRQGCAQNPSSQASGAHELRIFRCTSWLSKRQRNQRPNCQHSLGHGESKGVLEKHLHMLHWLHKSSGLCGSQQIVENSWRDGNTKPPYLSPEKPVCRTGSNS